MEEIIAEIDYKIDAILQAISGNPVFTQGQSMLDRLDRIEHSLYSGAGYDLIIGSAAIANQLTSTNYVAGVSGWLIDKSGNVEFQDGTFRGTIYAEDGDFSGSLDVSGTLTVTGDINVGTTPNRIFIQGTNDRIISETYSADVAGFVINGNGDAEFNNITVRGAIKSSVLLYNEVQAISGSVAITRASGVLAADVTTVASPTTFNVDVVDPPVGHTQLFSVGDILLLQEGGTVNWLSVDSVSDQTTFYRYVCTLENGSSHTWSAGGAVASYGASGDGSIVLSADATNAPHISVKTHAGSPWSTQTERLRLGNLNGSFGVSSDDYGIGFGDYASGNYVKMTTNTPTFTLNAGGGVLTIDEDGLSLLAGIDPSEGGEESRAVVWKSQTDGDTIARIRAFEDFTETSYTYFLIEALNPNATSTLVNLKADTSQAILYDSGTTESYYWITTTRASHTTLLGNGANTNATWLTCTTASGAYAQLSLGNANSDFVIKWDETAQTASIAAAKPLALTSSSNMTIGPSGTLAITASNVTLTTGGNLTAADVFVGADTKGLLTRVYYNNGAAPTYHLEDSSELASYADRSWSIYSTTNLVSGYSGSVLTMYFSGGTPPLYAFKAVASSVQQMEARVRPTAAGTAAGIGLDDGTATNYVRLWAEMDTTTYTVNIKYQTNAVGVTTIAAGLPPTYYTLRISVILGSWFAWYGMTGVPVLTANMGTAFTPSYRGLFYATTGGPNSVYAAQFDSVL